MLRTQHVTGPAHWASYFVNGDASGLTDAEQVAADAWLEPYTAEGWQVCDAPGEAWFTWSFSLHGGDCQGGDVVSYLMFKV